MKRLLSIPFIAGCMLFPGPDAQADLIVNRSIVEMVRGEARADVVLINSDTTSNLYIQVDPYAVTKPGETDQAMTKLTAEENLGMLVSPNKLVIPPGGRSVVRVLNLDPASVAERIYRINFIPVSPPVEIETPADDTVRSRLEVVVAYQVLVIVQPEQPVAVHAAMRTGTEAVFRNEGNSNYLMTDGEQCNPADAADCRQLPDRRVYPGNSWQLQLPFDGSFSYKLRKPDGMSVFRFD
jgi:P pilus assembly chaperone PapD